MKITDTQHFDSLPRFELIDAVDADGDGRGELLFRQISDAGKAFVIYRVIGDQLCRFTRGLPSKARSNSRILRCWRADARPRIETAHKKGPLGGPFLVCSCPYFSGGGVEDGLVLSGVALVGGAVSGVAVPGVALVSGATPGVASGVGAGGAPRC